MPKDHILIHAPADLGAALRHYLKALGLRQEKLVEQTGVSVPTIIAAEHGKGTAQIGTIFTLCRDLVVQMTAEI